MGWNDDNGPRNPWGNGGNNPDGQNPWGRGGNSGGGSGKGGGRGGNGGGGMPPDLEEMLKRAQDNFRNIMPGQWGFGRAALLAGAVGLVLWLSSGLYFVQPNENAVVLTFGKYTKTESVAGLKYALPWPMQQVLKVDVTSERRVEIGFNSGGAYGYQTADTSASESLMLTGDENIIDIDFVVTWRVGDAREYLFEIRNPDATIKLVAESAMREIIGRTKITAALTEARDQVQAGTKLLMQKILDDYQSGVVINNVQLLKVDPPDPVIDAFNDVQRARAEAERMQNEALAYRNDIIPRARGQAQKTLADAEAYKQEVIARSKGDADRFTSVYDAYAQSKDVTAERMYLETVEQILKNAKTVLLEGQGGQGTVPYLPVNELKRNPPALPQPNANAPR